MPINIGINYKKKKKETKHSGLLLNTKKLVIKSNVRDGTYAHHWFSPIRNQHCLLSVVLQPLKN